MIIEEYDVQNLNCANCSAKIESEIEDIKEVGNVNLDFINKRLTIQYNEKIDKPLERLNAIAARIEPGVQFTVTGSANSESKTRLWYIGLAIGFLVPAFFVSGWMGVIAGLAAYLVAGHKVLYTAVKELFSKQLFAEHFLMSLATLGALYLAEYTEAAAVMVLYEIGQLLETKALNRSRNTIKSMLSLKPEKAHVKLGADVVDKKLAEVYKDDIVLVYAGERIPLDGIVQKGESSVDTSSITGESEPVAVQSGTDVFAGFINQAGLLEIKVTNTEADSMISRIIKLVENATAMKAPTERFITRFARYYTPLVVVTAILVLAIPTLLGYSSSLWLKRSLVFLIVSCPCALVISIPLSYYIGLGKAAKHGVIFKGSIFLDLMAYVKILVFDKTGTLTTGFLRISDVYCSPNIQTKELEESLYLCEFTSSHPYAKAVKKAYRYYFNSSEVEAVSEYPGKGILLVYNKDRLMAGSEAFVKEFGFIDLINPGAKSAVHVVKNDIYLGCVTFEDEVKHGMKNTINKLRSYGISHLSMLSGDRKEKAESVAKELGLDSWHAELLPETKLSTLETMMKAENSLLAYCGDGLNDAPVLARANIGIAMGGIGSQASIETADVVLLNDKPEQLSYAFQISKQTRRLVWQNIVLALGIKILVMGLGLSGVSGLWEAIIADVGVTLLVIFNSLRMMKHRQA